MEKLMKKEMLIRVLLVILLAVVYELVIITNISKAKQQLDSIEIVQNAD